MSEGPRGAQGARGERGARGPHLPVRSIVVMFGIAVGLAVIAIFWINHAVNASAASQRRQGELLEARLCATLEPLAGLATLTPPPGNPLANPSRAFEQQLVVRLAPLAQLGPDLGCGRKP